MSVRHSQSKNSGLIHLDWVFKVYTRKCNSLMFLGFYCTEEAPLHKSVTLRALMIQGWPLLEGCTFLSSLHTGIQFLRSQIAVWTSGTLWKRPFQMHNISSKLPLESEMLLKCLTFHKSFSELLCYDTYTSRFIDKYPDKKIFSSWNVLFLASTVCLSSSKLLEYIYHLIKYSHWKTTVISGLSSSMTILHLSLLPRL